MEIVAKRIDLIKAMPPGSVGCEIGVWRGYFSIEILNETRVGKLFLVDSWKPRPEYNDPLSQDDHEKNLAECKHHIRGHAASGRVVIVRGDSLEIAAHPRKIPPLDWVYIDADHSYQACFADLEAWAARLKPTGVIMGHDYTDNDQAKRWNFGVIPAVTDFCAKHGWRLAAKTAEDFASYRLERLKL